MTCCFFFNDTATTEIYTLSLHDALPILAAYPSAHRYRNWVIDAFNKDMPYDLFVKAQIAGDLLSSSDPTRSEEHTSELQSRQYLVCRLLLEKKKYTRNPGADTRRNSTPS